MNYQKIYNDICNRGQIRVRVKEIGEYYERHHILPRCLGGNNDKLNLTLLTAREHFLCHYILAIKIYPNNHKLMYALWAMCKLENKYQNRSISSRVYEQARLSYIKMQSEKFKGKGNPQYRKLITNETRERLKEKRKLREATKINGRPISDILTDIISVNNDNKIISTVSFELKFTGDPKKFIQTSKISSYEIDVEIDGNPHTLKFSAELIK